MPLDKLLAFNDVRYVPVPTRLAPMLPIVPACTVLAIMVPLLVTAPTAKLVSVPTEVMLV